MTAPPDRTPAAPGRRLPQEPTTDGWLPRRRLWTELAFVAGVVLVSGWFIDRAAQTTGYSFDELFYVPQGAAGWHDWTDYRLVAWGTSPLAVDALTAPVALVEHVRGERFPYGDRDALRIARRANLACWALLLVSLARLCWRWGDPWAGRLAVLFVATDPTLLAHAGLATTDIPTAALVVAFAASLQLRSPRWWHVVGSGTWLGLAIAAKLSALPFGGIVLVVFGVAAVRAEGWKVRGVLLRVAAIQLLGVVIATAACGIDRGHKPMRKYAESLSATDPWKAPLLELGRHDHLPNIVPAAAFQARQNDVGRGVYLNGRWHPRGVWYFFPVAISMKLSVAMLVLGAAVVLACPKSFFTNAIAVAAVLMLLLSMASQVQLGLRYLFPVMALGAAGVARTLRQCWPTWGGRLGLATALATGVSTGLWWPHHFGFVNALYGGFEKAPRRLSDSNLDWGHGLPELARWAGENGHPALQVWYYGNDPQILQAPFVPVLLHALPISNPGELAAATKPGVVAVSYSMLTHDELYSSPSRTFLKYWFAQQKPIARTSMFAIYQLPAP